MQKIFGKKTALRMITLSSHLLFSYDKHAISIRTGSLIDKEDFMYHDQTNYGDALLAIEGKLKDISIEMEMMSFF